MKRAVAFLILFGALTLFAQQGVLGKRGITGRNPSKYTEGLMHFFKKEYEEAEDKFKVAAANVAEANVFLGQIYEKWAVQRDDPEYYCEAVRRYKIAARRRVAEGWYLLGNCYDQGLCLEEDPKEAYECYKKATKIKQLPIAHLKLGDLYMYGRGVEANRDKAIDQFAIAYETGLVEAKYNLALILYNQAPDRLWMGKDYLQLLEEAATEGVAKAWFKLGELHHTGLRLEPKPELAIQYYTKALEGDRDEAIYGIAALYDEFPQLDPDGKKLEAALIICLQDGSADAARKLAEHYINAERLEQNIPKALELLESAIKGNDAEAYYILGHMNWYGLHIEKNQEKALQYMKKAEELGSERARTFLNNI